MAAWLYDGARVHRPIRPAPNSAEILGYRNGTVITARGDYSDVEWDDAPGKLATVYNGEVELTPNPALT